MVRILIILLFPLGMFAQLSGTYTVGGATPDYATPKLAVDDLNSVGVSGAVIFNIRDGIYDEKFAITNVTGASAVNTITIQSESQDSTAVTIKDTVNAVATNYVIALSGSKYVTLKWLTIELMPPYSNSYAKCISINMDATYGGNSDVSYCTIENCIINGTTASTSSNFNRGCISSGGISQVDFISKGLTIRNNIINDGGASIYLAGNLFNQWITEVTIENNYMNTFTNGVYVEYYDSVNIIGNHFFHDSRSTSTSANYYMTWLEDGRRARIYRNKYEVDTIQNTVYSLYLNDNRDRSIAETQWIVNNFFSINSTTKTSTSLPYNCIRIVDTTKARIYYNNINIYHTDATMVTAGIWFSGSVGTASGHPELRNNIIKNHGVAVGQTAMWISQSGEAPDVDSDYNNWDVNDTYAVRVQTSYYTLAGWQTLESEDANTLQLNPEYVSNTDLHIENESLIGQGEYISLFTTDYDGDIRANPPTIGADEITPTPFNPLISNGRLFNLNGKLIRIK